MEKIVTRKFSIYVVKTWTNFQNPLENEKLLNQLCFDNNFPSFLDKLAKNLGNSNAIKVSILEKEVRNIFIQRDS